MTRARVRQLLIGAGAAVVLAVALGPRVVLESRDLHCPAGRSPRPLSIVSWAITCVPDATATAPASVPLRRYVGVFLANADVRVFDVDLVLDKVHGPALGVKLGR